MKAPDDIEHVLLEIVENGILHIRTSAEKNQYEICRIEADHLHNIPGLILSFSPDRIEFYLDVEVAQYLRETNGLVPEKMHSAWNYLRSWLLRSPT